MFITYYFLKLRAQHQPLVFERLSEARRYFQIPLCKLRTYPTWFWNKLKDFKADFLKRITTAIIILKITNEIFPNCSSRRFWNLDRASSIRASTSSLDLLKFSMLKAYTVTSVIPKSKHHSNVFTNQYLN